MTRLIKTRIANGSSRSASGWTGKLLLPLIEDEECLIALAQLIQDIINNNLSEDSKQILLLSRLIALSKPNDLTTPRPIAVGDVFYKTAALYTLYLINKDLPSIFKDIQLGVGVKGGSELAAHIIQAAIDTRGPNSTTVLFDQQNGFNAASREEMITEAFKYQCLAPAWNLIQFGYGNPSLLALVSQGEIVDVILSQEGCRQGDPIGTLLFCLYFMPKIEAIANVVPGKAKTPTAIVDDLTITTDDHSQALSVYDKANSILKLNKNKTKILWPHDHDPPPELVQGCLLRNVELIRGATKALGTLVGVGDQNFTDFAVSKVESYDGLLEAVEHP